MVILDFLLNVAALLLWLSWRAVRLTAVPAPARISIVGALKRTEREPARGWGLLVALVAVLVLRGVLYHHIGAGVHWTAQLGLGVTVLLFRSDFLGQMWIYSLASFGRTFCLFYLWLGFFSLLHRGVEDPPPTQRFIRSHLGRLDRLPLWGWVAGPVALGAAAWTLSQPLLRWLRAVPAGGDWLVSTQQGAAIALAALVSWRYLILAVLALYLLSSYIYFGESPFWGFIDASARRLLRPLRPVPLVLGRIDLAPLVLGLAVWLAGELAGQGLLAWYRRLPL
ncbi:MAG TPA: hypothetical protein VNO52_16890 [Methylomirabilota bacterium]|nr:hypothetical protein [Methylomirabilota bacterium]